MSQKLLCGGQQWDSYLTPEKRKMKGSNMHTKTLKWIQANEVTAGTCIVVSHRRYRVIKVAINCGALGDYVAFELYDELANRFTTYSSELEAEFQVIA